MNRWHWILALALVLALPLARAQEAPPLEETLRNDGPVRAAVELRGEGAWKGREPSAAANQRWTLHVRRGADNSLRGQLTFLNSPLGATGTLEGRIVGDTITGTVSGDDGAELATITGVVTGDTVRGTYRDREGGEGQWWWIGALPP
jgi:hypothetical protein